MSDDVAQEGKRVEERLTEDLLEELLKTERPEDYLLHEVLVDETLPGYLNELLAERGISRAAVGRASGITSAFLYELFAGESAPRRDTAIMLAFGLGCTLKEAQRLLKLAGLSELWPRRHRDAVIIWCIDRGMSRVECDDELYRLGEEPLFKEE